MSVWYPMSKAPQGKVCELKLADTLSGEFVSPGRWVLDGEEWYRDGGGMLDAEHWPIAWRPAPRRWAPVIILALAAAAVVACWLWGMAV